jgi:hypothetical protein
LDKRVFRNEAALPGLLCIELLDGITSHDYLDAFGNTCTRLVARPGLLEIRNDFIIRDSGQPDAVVPDAQQWTSALCRMRH